MTSPIDGTVRQLRRLIGGAEQEALADRQLLARYLASKDEAAFAALVKRHASMVLGVCRRVLACPQDAEDACQATFLVLAKKATSIHLRESLRCWLHGVAFRVASNLRRQKLRRKVESLADAAAPADDVTLRELRRVLDAELLRLPEQFRLPLILCYLEGKTRDEAAEELGWSLSTFKGRLERGRAKLRARLERKAIGLPAALLAAGLAGSLAVAAVPAVLLESLVRGVASPAAHNLSEGAMRTMFIGKFAASLGALAVSGLIGLGVFLLRGHEQVVEAAAPPAREAVKESAAHAKLAAEAPVLDDELAAKLAKAKEEATSWLKKSQKEDGSWEKSDPVLKAWPGGASALALLALLENGVDSADPVIVKGLKFLRDTETNSTYSVALQTAALCKANNLKDAKIIQRNVNWLAEAAVRDAAKNLMGWTYQKTPDAGRADFSNTHFSVMGLQAAQRVGIAPKSGALWKEIALLYRNSQLPTGGWGYTAQGQTTHSMTCASLAALLAADEAAPQGKAGPTKEREKGLAWVASNFSLASSSGSFYNLHAIARLGAISGERTFGKHDWFREGAEWLLKHRHTDGSFTSKAGVDASPVVSTSFALLFLSAAPPKTVIFNAPLATEKDVRLYELWSKVRAGQLQLERFKKNVANEELRRELGWTEAQLTEYIQKKQNQIDDLRHQLDQTIKELTAQADRIVVATASGVPDSLPAGEHVRLGIVETLKGQPQKSLLVIQGTNDASILNQESTERRRWIVFLRSQDEGPWPKSAPLLAQNWFIDADNEVVAKIKAALPLPSKWDNGDGPIRLGVRLRPAKIKSGADVAIEVVLKNASENANDAPLPVLAHRMNIYDYWPHTTFEVVAPSGKTYILEKPAGTMSEADVPNTIQLGAGETYIQVMHLNLWPAMTAEGRLTTGEPLANLFTKPGHYTIRCRYEHTQVKGPAATLVSNTVKITVE
jgi:RNA polymerase sigma factor (sigma-70 family)